MAYRCEICKKGVASGNSLSHSHHAVKRRFLPNLQKIKVKLAARGPLGGSGTVRRILVCTACIRSGKIQKAL